jgi:hypothetical protein
MISMSTTQLTFDDVLKAIQNFKLAELEVLGEEINKLKKLWCPEMTDFEIGVRQVQDTLTNFVQNANSSNNFQELCAQAQALSAYVKEQPRYRRHLLAVLQIALRRVNPSEITTEHRLALQYLGNQLLLKNPSFEEVVAAKRKLTQAQISMLPTMGELADEFIRLVKEDREPE